MYDFLDEDCEDIVTGVYIWEGKLVCDRHQYYGGDYDYEEWLEGKLRPATKEEWEFHLNDEYPWDPSLWYKPEELYNQVIFEDG
jgi:hypothetical protein